MLVMYKLGDRNQRVCFRGIELGTNVIYPSQSLLHEKGGVFFGGGAIFAVPARQNDLGILCSCLSNTLFMVNPLSTQSFATQEMKRDRTGEYLLGGDSRVALSRW